MYGRALCEAAVENGKENTTWTLTSKYYWVRMRGEITKLLWHQFSRFSIAFNPKWKIKARLLSWERIRTSPGIKRKKKVQKTKDFGKSPFFCIWGLATQWREWQKGHWKKTRHVSTEDCWEVVETRWLLFYN